MLYWLDLWDVIWDFVKCIKRNKCETFWTKVHAVRGDLINCFPLCVHAQTHSVFLNIAEQLCTTWFCHTQLQYGFIHRLFPCWRWPPLNFILCARTHSVFVSDLAISMRLDNLVLRASVRSCTQHTHTLDLSERLQISTIEILNGPWKK